MAAAPEPDELHSADLHQKVSYLPDIHRLLPQAPDAERGVLCSFLLAPREIGALCVEKGITVRHFHLPAHGTIYAVLMEFWNDNEPIDFISITQWMRNKGTLESAGGSAFVTELFTYLPTAANCGYYIEILCEKFTLRQIIMTCTQYAARCYDEQDNVPDLLFSAQRDIHAISNGTLKVRRPFKEVLMAVIHGIEHGTEATADVTSGVLHLDSLVKMRRGNFIVIGGQAKSGKTALAGTIATHCVLAGQRVVIISLEMDVAEMVKRMLASAGRVNVSRIGKVPSDSEYEGVVRGANALKDIDVELVDDCYDLNEIVAQCRKLHLEKPLDLIVVDYLQLIEWSTGRRGETRQEVVAQISRMMKKLAMQLNCVLIGLSQLNEDGKLRESRAIGQDANAIIGVDKESDGERVIRIVDQRNGPSDIRVQAKWLPWCTTFDNPDQPEQEPDLVHMGKLSKTRPKKTS